MQPNYQEMTQRLQQDYQRSRDPFEYGRQVAQRRYSEIMSNLDAQKQMAQQSYGDLYSQARQQAVRGQAMGGPTLSGGMGQQQRDYISAIEMQQLGQIGNQRNTAMRDLFSQGQAAFSNAQLEGQQATQMELQNQQTQLQLVQQRQSILENANLSAAQKAEQLEALGTTPEAVAEKQRSWDQWITTGALTFAGGATLVTGAAKLGTVIKGAGAITQIAKLGGVTVKSVTAAMSASKAVGLGLGLSKAGTFLAASMAAHPVGWAIGAIVVGALAISAIAGAVRNS